jgi:hypothetical protein
MRELDKYSIFMPKSEYGLKVDYPELAHVAQFKTLSSDELLLVWYFACEASPLVDKYNDESKRIKEAIKIVFNKKQLPGVKKTAYESLKFPDRLHEAIEVMKTYKIGPRVRSKIMLEHMMKNFEQIINADVKTFIDEDGNIDFAKQKSYVDASTNVAKNLPTIIQQIERGYGVVELEERTAQEEELSSTDGSSLIDEYHDETDNEF